MKKNLLLALAVMGIALPVFAGRDSGSNPVLDRRELLPAPSLAPSGAPERFPGPEPGRRRPAIGELIMGGVLGNILGSATGVYLGAPTLDEEHPWSFISYWAAGSALGSAAGASLAGHSHDWKGSLGMATVGGVLGAGLSWIIVSSSTFQQNASVLSLVPLLILPPVGAAIFYNASLRPRRLPGDSALLNFSQNRLGLGVPTVQVRPLFVPGTDAKPSLQFSVRVLGVEL